MDSFRSVFGLIDPFWRKNTFEIYGYDFMIDSAPILTYMLIEATAPKVKVLVELGTSDFLYLYLLLC